MRTFTWLYALSLPACSVVLAGVASAAGDPAVGKAKAEEVCSECHESADFAGQDAASLSSKIHGIVSGKVKHKKKLALSEAEIESIVAYWASGG